MYDLKKNTPAQFFDFTINFLPIIQRYNRFGYIIAERSKTYLYRILENYSSNEPLIDVFTSFCANRTPVVNNKI